MGKQITEKAVKVQNKTKRLAKVKQEHPQSQPQQEEHLPKQEQQDVPAEEAKSKAQARSKGKRNRLIIRNLVFDITDKHLRKLLTPFGEIEDLEIPTNPNNSKCNRGFAFVEYKNYRSCEKAIKQLNQSTYKGRTIVLDFSVNKQRFLTHQLEQKPEQKQEQKEEKQVEKKEEPQEQIQQQDPVETEKEKEEALQKQRSVEDLTCTIFIRNLPLSVSQEQLRQFFAKYGKVRWARVVVDRETNSAKGTAFVRFVDPQVAQQIIEYSRSYEMFLLNKNPRFRSDPRLSLELDGTILKVFPTQKRQALAQKVKQRQGKEAEKAVKVKPLKKIRRLKDLIQFDKDGKRKIALAELGLWEPSDEMAEEDRERFAAHAREKIEKLKNPNNSVSDTRIILKLLDKAITEEQLRDLAHEFLNAHRLSPKQLTYCKLMLDTERKRSAGFAFIEFAHPQNSRTFVEELSENYSYLSKRPYVIEFAIQDSRKLQKLTQRRK